MLLHAVVQTSEAVAAVPSRKAKVDAIAALLHEVPPEELAVAVAYLSGELTQRQIGVGYAALAGEFTAGKPAETPVLTLTETDQALGAIGKLSGPGSQADRRRLLAGLFARATSGERHFLARLIAGDLGQGALAGIMIEAIAATANVPAATVRRAHQLSGSLALAAASALAPRGAAGTADTPVPLAAIGLRVGRPVRPMLAASADTVADALHRVSPAAIEWKIDGVRIQVHRQGERIRVFTRTLEDITDRVPEIVAVARSLPVDVAVIDGEAVALRPDGRPRPFQVTSARTASRGRGGDPATATPLTPFLFDLLHVDGSDLVDAPAGERFDRLAQVAPADLLVPRVVTTDVSEAEEFYRGALARGHEGVVIKSLDAAYGVGRRGAEWIKVKPVHTLDLIVLAAEWGHGRRRGWLSNLHLGARAVGGGPPVMLGKTFKGLTDELLAWQTERLLDLADPARSHGTDTAERHGVVRVRPELVVEIAFDGVQASSRYPGGVTLRFARVLRYRPDKSAAEADTIDAVRALWRD